MRRALTAPSCDSGYQVCAILSVFGRAAVLSASLSTLTALSYAMLTAVWGARTYAVFNRSRAILCIFIPLGMFTMVLATVRALPFFFP